MKILITDDTAANLEAAKMAAMQFPEIEFVFTSSANEAFRMLPTIDAVITDLFFVENATSDLAIAYEAYIEQVKPELLLQYYKEEDLAYYTKNIEENIEILLSGIPKGAIKKIAEQDPKTYQSVMDKASKLPQEFPLGGTIMISAKRQGKKMCLVSNVHRHAGSYEDSTSSAAAVLLLAPLLGDILNADQLMFDGEGSLTYIGESEIREHDEKIENTWNRTGKTDPKVWIEAIRRVLAQ